MSALLDAVRQKYPQCADKSDDELALAIGSKYPTYLDRDADFKKEFTASRIQAEMALKPSPKPDLGQPFAEVQPGGRVIQRMPGNDPERNREEFQKGLAMPGRFSEAVIGDIAAGMRASPDESGNIPAALKSEPLPMDTALSEAAKEAKFRGEKPVAAITGRIAQGLAGTAPMIPLLGGLPSLAQKAVLLGFTAKMVKDTPEIAKQLGDEFGKPPEQRDPDKIAQLVSSAIQTVGLTAAGGVGLKRGFTPANPLATIGDHLEAKGIELPSGKPVAESEAPKPPQTPSAPEKPTTVRPEAKATDWDKLYKAEHEDLIDAQRRMEQAREDGDNEAFKSAKIERDDTIQRLQQFDKLSKRESGDIKDPTADALASNPNMNLSQAISEGQRMVQQAGEDARYDAALDEGKSRKQAAAQSKGTVFGSNVGKNAPPLKDGFYASVTREEFDTRTGRTVPAYTQMDEFRDGQNVRSGVPDEELRKMGMPTREELTKSKETGRHFLGDKPEASDVSSVKPAFRNPPTTGFSPDSPKAASIERHTLGENTIQSALLTAGAYEKPVYIGGKPETTNSLASPPTVSRTKPSYVAATIHPDGKVELENGWYRIGEENKEPQATPVTPEKSPSPPAMVSSETAPPVKTGDVVQKTTPKEGKEQVGKEPAPQMVRTPFSPDDMLELRSPHADEVVNVSYRGPLGADRSVVWTGKTQMSIPTEWLSRSRASQLEILKKQFEEANQTLDYASEGIEKGQPYPPEYHEADRKLTELLKQIQELERPQKEQAEAAKASEKEAHTKAQYAARDKRVAEAKTGQKRNGWEIVKEGVNYVLRDPFTKEEVYRGKLGRVRQVADESTPEAEPTVTSKPAKAETAPKTPESKSAVPPIAAKFADRFRKLAEGMDKSIEDKRRAMTQNPTPKRNREYRSRLHDADNMERVQNALRALALAHEQGTLPPILADVRSKADVQPLVTKGLLGGGYYDVIPSNDYANTTPKAKAMQQLLEAKPETAEEAQTRSERENKDKISQMEEKLRFSNIPGFFPTPKPLAEEMVSRADIQPGQTVLEPSAGKGDLADAIKAREPEAKITAVERMNTLREILEAKGYAVAPEEDFLQHKGQYDRIVMNPPFEKGQDIAHVRHAYDQLKPGGKLVALMSEGSFSRGDSKATEFRQWLDEVNGTSEKAAEGSFKGVQAFRQTGVASRIVEIEKPSQAQPASVPQAVAKEGSVPNGNPKVGVPFARMGDYEFALTKGGLPERPETYGVGMRRVGTTGEFESGGYGYHMKPEGVMERWASKEASRGEQVDFSHPKAEAIYKSESERLAKIEGEKQAAAKRKQEADTQKSNGWNEYQSAVKSVTLPKGKQGTITVQSQNGEPLHINGTSYGDWLINKSESKYDESPYRVTHIKSGLGVSGGGFSTLAQAKDYVRALIHSKFKTDWVNADAFKRNNKAEFDKISQVGKAWLSGGDVPEYFKAPQIEPISRGPGAASAGEPGTYSPIQRMADELRTAANQNAPIDEQLKAMDRAKAAGQDIKDSLTRTAAKTKAVADALWQKWKGLPEYGDEQRAVGKWFYALQRADHEARQFAKAIVKEVPNKIRREAITNWIQADGDSTVLQQRAQASKGTIRQGYEIADKLTPRELEIAQMLRDYYGQQLERGLASGIIKEGLENYITQVWKKENPITKKLVSELSQAKLQPNFKYARKRLFDSYFEGEQAGYTPNKDAGFLVANYDQTFNRSLAARAFIKDLHEGKASDGRPLVELSGQGRLIEGKSGKDIIIVKPKAKPEELNDYRTIDHPALRGWKFITTTPEGINEFMQGDMLVHPEAYQKLKNRLSVSAFRQNPVTRTLLDAQTQVKQTMLSLSGFHLVQEGLHALGHRVNPLNLPEIDFSEPTTKALAEHGLQLADYDALSSFSEGLSGSGLLGKVPGLGPKLHAYNEWLFQDYIPRLKLQMAKLALERNRERYKTLDTDKLLEQTARQANAAFGELPYRYWGRSPTLQDALRTFVLAPDFLEARARFVGRAVRPYGREQLVALGFLAATQYLTARIVNQLVDKDPHWELKNAFRIVAGGHAYGLRSIPGDMLHLFSDTRGFFYNRMSPLLRTSVEYVTGRDDKGVKRDLREQAKDALSMPLPIAMKPRAGQKWWEAFFNSFGVQEQRWDAVQTIEQKAADFKKSRQITSPVDIVYDREKDQYSNLRTAIENMDEKTAKEEAAKLEKTIPKSKILQHFRLSLTRPFTGSHKHEQDFLKTLNEAGREEYKEAMDLRHTRLEMARRALEQ